MNSHVCEQKSIFNDISISTWLMYVLVWVQSYIWKKLSLCCSRFKVLPMWVTEPKAFLFRYILLGLTLSRTKLICLCIYLGTLHIEHIWFSLKITHFKYFSNASFMIKMPRNAFFRFCRLFTKCSLELQNLLTQTFCMKWEKRNKFFSFRTNPGPWCRWEESENLSSTWDNLKTGLTRGE